MDHTSGDGTLAAGGGIADGKGTTQKLGPE